MSTRASGSSHAAPTPGLQGTSTKLINCRRCSALPLMRARAGFGAPSHVSPQFGLLSIRQAEDIRREWRGRVSRVHTVHCYR
jgi:hypothetical protein